MARAVVCGVACAAAAALPACSPPPVAPPKAAAVASPASAGGWFRDVTAVSGIDFVHATADGAMDNLVESVGAGVTCLDYDDDGRMDLFFTAQGWRKGVSSGDEVRGRARNRLFRNVGGGRFEDTTDRAGVGDDGFATSAVAADLDDDGRTDLFVLADGGNRLLRNRGDGTFEDTTARAGIAGSACSVAGAAFDADGDGDLDVYVGNYVRFEKDYKLYYKPDVFPGPLAYAAQADVLWVNQVDGTFVDGTKSAGMDVPPGRAMGVSVLDFDADGRPDVYVANDATANFLFRNEGAGRFREIAVDAGCAFGVQGDATASMAAMVGDVNEDGVADLHVTDASYGSLLLGGRRGFNDRILTSGIAASSGQWASWGGGLFDFDADGHLDLYVANGDSHRATGRPDLLFRGKGDGTFDDVSDQAGAWFREERCGRGGCVVDVDDDARLDVVLTHLDDRAVVLRNEAPQNGHGVLVALRARPRNASGQGAKVTIEAAGRTFTQTAWPRCGYLTQGDPRLHFGLGAATRIERIEVTWPDGSRDEARGLAVDRVVTVRQGTGFE